MDNLKILEDFYEGFEYFLEVIVLLEKCGRWLISLSNFDSLETLKRFSQKDFFEYNDVSEASEVIDEFKILEQNGDYSCKKNERFNKIAGFTYTHIMNFKKASNVKGTIFSANFLSNVNCLVHAKNVVHHSHITGDIIG